MYDAERQLNFLCFLGDMEEHAQGLLRRRQMFKRGQAKTRFLRLRAFKRD